MRALTIEDLNAAAHVGGASSLVMRQELEPASGPDGVIAPAKYVDSNGNATYIIEKRYMEGEENPAKVVLIDSKTSFANRAEATTTEAMRNGEGILSKMPHIAVEYDVDDGKNVFYDNRYPCVPQCNGRACLCRGERREPKACWRAAAAHSSSSGVDGEPPLAGR